MSQRRAALLVAIGAALIGAPTIRGCSPTEIPTRARLEPSVLAPASRAAERPRRRDARDQAKTFLRGFLAFEQARHGAHARQEIRRSSTPRVSDYLISVPPWPGGRSSSPGRYVALHMYGPRAGAIKASTLIRRSGNLKPQLFEFTLRLERHTWRVSELYP